MASSSASLPTPGRSLMRPTQPPRLKPSSPAGSSTTPSSETFSLTRSFPCRLDATRNNPLVVLAGGTGAVDAVLLASALVPPLVAVFVARVAWLWAKSDDEDETVGVRDLLRRAFWLDRGVEERKKPSP